MPAYKIVGGERGTRAVHLNPGDIVQTYLDLLAARLDVDPGLETIRKFNQVSLRWGLDDRL